MLQPLLLALPLLTAPSESLSWKDLPGPKHGVVARIFAVPADTQAEFLKFATDFCGTEGRVASGRGRIVVVASLDYANCLTAVAVELFGAGNSETPTPREAPLQKPAATLAVAANLRKDLAEVMDSAGVRLSSLRSPTVRRRGEGLVLEQKLELNAVPLASIVKFVTQLEKRRPHLRVREIELNASRRQKDGEEKKFKAEFVFTETDAATGQPSSRVPVASLIHDLRGALEKAGVSELPSHLLLRPESESRFSLTVTEPQAPFRLEESFRQNSDLFLMSASWVQRGDGGININGRLTPRLPEIREE